MSSRDEMMMIIMILLSALALAVVVLLSVLTASLAFYLPKWILSVVEC